MPQNSNFRYVLVTWLFVLSVVAYMARQVVTVTGPFMGADFGMDNNQLGTVFSALLIGYAAFQIPGGWLAGRYGPRKVLTVGLVLWALFSVLTNFIPLHVASSLVLLILVRGLLGAAEGVMYPCSNQFIANWFPASEHGMANGWVFAGVGAGSAVTPLIVTWLLVAGGWQGGFWFMGALGLIAAVIWYALARDKPEEHPSMSAAELAHIKAGIKSRPVSLAGKTPWSRILGSRSVWGIAIAYVGYGYVGFIIISWFFIYMLKGRGVDMHKSAVYSLMPFFAMTVCCLGGAWISDKISVAKGTYMGRCLFGAASLILTAVFLVTGAAASDTLEAAALLSCATGALYLGQSSYWAVTSNVSGPFTGIVSGLINMFGQIAGAITAKLTPWIAEQYGWAMAFYVAAVVAVVCAMGWFMVDPGRRLDTSEEQITA